MPVVATKTELRCKLCRHQRRSEIDALIERQKRRELDDAGVRITIPYVLERLGEWGIENPTLDNLKIHWGKHCEMISDAQAAEATEKFNTALEALSERLLGRDLGPDTLTDDLIEIAQVSLREQVAQGVMPKVTIDQALKAVDTKTRRKHNDKVNALLEIQAAAITLDLGVQLPALEAGEVVEVDDDDS